MGAWIGDIPPETSAARLREAVASDPGGDRSDAPPHGTWSAPGRVNLIGEHTDYNDGFVLPFAIQHRTHVALTPRDDGVIRVIVDLRRRCRRGAARRARRALPDAARRGRRVGALSARRRVGAAARVGHGTRHAVTGVDLAFTSDVPVGAGLSSSAAIEGATASALNDTWELGLDRVALAQVGRTAENEAVGAPTGIMDQMASMLGRADAAIFLDCRSLEATVVDLGFADAGPRAARDGHRRASTRTRPAATASAAPRASSAPRSWACRRCATCRSTTSRARPSSWTTSPSAASATSSPRTSGCSTPSARCASDGPAAIGDLLVASHASMRDDFEISVPELDTAVEAALAAGAVGARMTGGGFGGAAIALVAHDRVRAR